MIRYDLYSICRDSGLLIHWQKFEAASDEDARDLALGFGFPLPVELWKGEVLLTRWDDRDQAQSQGITSQR